MPRSRAGGGCAQLADVTGSKLSAAVQSGRRVSGCADILQFRAIGLVPEPPDRFRLARYSRDNSAGIYSRPPRPAILDDLAQVVVESNCRIARLARCHDAQQRPS